MKWHLGIVRSGNDDRTIDVQVPDLYGDELFEAVAPCDQSRVFETPPAGSWVKVYDTGGPTSVVQNRLAYGDRVYSEDVVPAWYVVDDVALTSRNGGVAVVLREQLADAEKSPVDDAGADELALGRWNATEKAVLGDALNGALESLIDTVEALRAACVAIDTAAGSGQAAALTQIQSDLAAIKSALGDHLSTLVKVAAS